MPTPVTLIAGDGVGPSIADATVRVLEAAGADIAWDPQVAGQAGVAAHGDPMPEPTLDVDPSHEDRPQGPARDAGGRRASAR